MRKFLSPKIFLSLLFSVNWIIPNIVYCKNQTLNDNVLATVYKTFYTIVKLSNNFRQFPMRDDFKKAISSPETQTIVFHQRLLKLLELYGISRECREDILQLNIGLENGEEWARRMVDSMSKPDARMVDLRFHFDGSYDECIKVKAKVQNPHLGANKTTGLTSSNRAITSSYFYTIIILPLDIVPASSQYLIVKYFPRFFKVDTCLPDTCSATDVNLVIQAVAGQIEKRTSPVPSKTFSQKHIELPTGGYVVIGILVFLAILLVTGTAYDVLVLKLKWKSSAADISPKRYVKRNVTRVLNDEAFKQSDTAASDNMRQEVNRLLLNTEADDKKVITTEDKPDGQRTGKLHEFFMAFSLIRHCKELLEIRESKTRIGAIEGIRVLTMSWIILMHTALYAIFKSGNADLFYRDKDGDWTFFALIVPNTVDTFFTVSAVLVTYLSLKRMEKDGGPRKFPWAKYYLMRFWRISPAFYLTFFVFWKVFPSLNSGPLWINPDLSTSQLHTCDNLWWQTLFYINNLWIKDIQRCSTYLWYLAADTQFYIVSPLLLIAFFRFPKVAAGIAGFLIAASAIATGVLGKIFKFLPSLSFLNMREGDDLFSGISHMYPIGHLAPWMIGMLLGYVLYSRRNTIKIPTWLNIVGWCLSAISVACVLFLPATAGTVDFRKIRYSDLNTVYFALTKTVWSGAVAWVIFSCAIGRGGFINTFLSWKPFVVLGRLTFCTYLVHLMVILFYQYSRRTGYYLSDVNLAFDSVAATTMSHVVGFLLSVCVERPMFALKDIFFKQERLV